MNNIKKIFFYTYLIIVFLAVSCDWISNKTEEEYNELIGADTTTTIGDSTTSTTIDGTTTTIDGTTTTTSSTTTTTGGPTTTTTTSTTVASYWTSIGEWSEEDPRQISMSINDGNVYLGYLYTDVDNKKNVKVVKKEIVGGSWTLVGSGNVNANEVSTGVVIDVYNGTPYAALVENNNGSPVGIVKKFNNTNSSWEIFAAPFSGGANFSGEEIKGSIDMKIYDGKVVVAYTDDNAGNDYNRAKISGGSEWALIGGNYISTSWYNTKAKIFVKSGITPTFYNTSINTGDPLSAAAGNKIYLSSCLGVTGNWKNAVGISYIENGYVAPTDISLTLNSTGDTYIAYSYKSESNIRVKEVLTDGTDTVIGVVNENGDLGRAGQNPDLAFDSNGNLYIAFAEYSSGWKLTVMKLGTDDYGEDTWISVDTDADNIGLAAYSNIALKIYGTDIYVGCIGSDNKAKVYKHSL